MTLSGRTWAATPNPRGGHRSRSWPLAAGLAVGYLADALLGDPRRHHPVAGFGTVALLLERRIYTDRRTSGVLHTVTLVGSASALGIVAERLARGRPVLMLAVSAAATWTVLGGRSLRREAATIERQLRAGEFERARLQLRHLVGRDTSALDEQEAARATIESVAENTSDAVVAPLLWGAIAGVPGLLAYRAVNTLDAMVGHRSPRYLHFGWSAARLDDAANWLPARCSAVLAAALAPQVSGSVREALRVARRDARQHPSPNAGVVEAAFAGALGVRLGGANVYHGELEDRGTLGGGRAPTAADIARANRLAATVSAAALLGASIAGGLLRSWSRRFRR